MFNKLLTILAILASSSVLYAQQSPTVLQGGSSINGGATLNVSPNAPITVTVTPPTASVGVGNAQNFTATLTNDITNAGVTWKISGGPSCTIAQDNFDRPNEDPIKSPWLLTGSDQNGQLLNNSFAGYPLQFSTNAYYVGNVNWTKDQFAQATIGSMKDNSGFMGLILNSFWLVGWQVTTPSLGTPQQVTVLEGGVPPFVNLGTFIPHPGDVIRATALNSVISFYQNGNLIGSLDETGQPFLPNGAGLNASDKFTSNPLDLTWDNWLGGQLPQGNLSDCASISPAFSRSGQTVVFTAPAVLPANPAMTITATSVADPTKFATATVTITQQPPSTPTIISFTTNTPKQPGANTLTFAAPNMVGDTPVVVATMKDGANVTSVVDQLGRTFTSVGCQEDVGTVGHTVMFYQVGNSQTITSVTVNSTGTAGGNVDVGYLDMNTGSTSQPDVAAVCSGTAVATTNPLGPAVTTASVGDVIVTAITVTNTATGIQTPFTFGALTRGDGMAYAVVGPTGTYTPNWTQTSGGWAGVTAAFRVGAQPPNLSVSLNPTCVTVQTGQTQIFTNTVTNDTAHAGSNLTLAGTQCSGATCGTVSPNTAVQSGTNVTYTAPGTVPNNPNVVLTDTSVTDGTKAAVACITVTSSPNIGVSVSPTTINLAAGSSAQVVTATLTNDTSNLGVTWALSGATCTGSGCGTLSGATKTTVTYTPPPTVTVNTSVTLTATAVGDVTKKAITAITVTPVVQPQPNCQPTCPNFPGAQGGGAAGVGGRGGAIIEVTNLNDSGTGSLRACVTANGPRNCVFRVAGIIPVTSGDLRVDNPFLSVDGQTAPGQIIIGGPNTNGEVFRISTHDVTIQYVTISADNKNTLSGPSSGTVGLTPTNCQCYNIVIDHVSTRWAGNKMLINVSNFVGPNRNISFQNSMLYEPHEGHPVGPGTSGNPLGCPNAAPDPNLANPCFTTLEVQVDYHHDFFANIDHRIPENDNKSSAFISNIVYNWSFYANEWLGPETIDVVNNKFVPGNLNSGIAGPGGCSSFGCAGPAQTFPVHFSGNNSSELPTNGGTTVPSIYLAGNLCRGATSPATDQYSSCANQISGENGNETGAIPSSWKRTSIDPRTFPITQDAATTLDSLILPLVGNSQHLNCDGSFASHRDAADSRVINQYKVNGLGGFWPNGVSYVGQGTIPTPSGTYVDQPITAGFTLCTESLHDGIADAWKTKFGLSLTDTGLGARINTKNGFSYYENYKYGLVP